MNTSSQLLETLLGIGVEPKQLTFLQVSVRGVIVFIAALIMVRLSSKRSLAEKTAFEWIRGFFSHAGHWIPSGGTTPAFRLGGILFTYFRNPA